MGISKEDNATVRVEIDLSDLEVGKLYTYPGVQTLEMRDVPETSGVTID